MAIEQLQDPCVVPSWEGDERSDTQASHGGHYQTGDTAPWLTTSTQLAFHKQCGGIVVFGLDAYCTGCEDESLGDSDWETRTVVPRTLADACWVAASDGERCGGEFEDEDSGAVQHRSSRAVLERDLQEAGWTVLTDGRVYCPDDKPEGGAPEVAAAIPGQEPLFGGEG